MSWDINHVVIVGRLTKDPDLSYTQSGAAVCKFSIAVNRSSGQSTGNQEDKTSYFNVVTWNKTAEICKEYLARGKQVGIDGRLQQRRWVSQDGMKKNTVEIVANNVQFFGSSRQAQEEYTKDKVDEIDSVKASPFDEKKDETVRDPYISELDDDEIPF